MKAPRNDVGPYAPVGADWHDEVQSHAVLAERLAGWQERYPDVRVHRRVVCDDPARRLAEESERAQLVVAGTGHRRLKTPSAEGWSINGDEPMNVGPRRCTIAIAIDEAEDGTRAVAQMNWQGRNLAGVGGTRPSEMFPDQLSERLAISRALLDLVARLHSYDEKGTFAPDAPPVPRLPS